MVGLLCAMTICGAAFFLAVSSTEIGVTSLAAQLFENPATVGFFLLFIVAGIVTAGLGANKYWGILNVGFVTSISLFALVMGLGVVHSILSF